jgi:carbonic anhydrase
MRQQPRVQPAHASAASSRRRFFQLSAASALAVAAGTATLTPTRNAAAAGSAAALLLNCIDYRLTSDVTDYMTARGLKHAYDQIILAGASLGALTPTQPDWNATFWDHVDIAIQLHGIASVVVIDHRDCGAYKVILGEDFAADPARETEVHTQWLHALRDWIGAKHPDLQVELFLMALDGTVEAIA